MVEWLSTVFTGQTLAFIGIFLSVGLCGIGSAKGVGIVGEAGAGLMTEDPAKFPQILVLQIIPSTNGIYGFVAAMIAMVKIDVFNGVTPLDFGEGALVLAACLPIAFVGFLAAIAQARVVAGMVSVIAKRPEEMAKGIMVAAMVEFFPIIALLVSVMMIVSLPF